MDAAFIRAQSGLVPADDETRQWFGKLRMGAAVAARVSQTRNPLFHRKMFALMQLAFEHWSDTAPAVQFRGETVRPDFERFRKDVTILAGKFHTVVNIKGELRIEADSLAYGKMNNEEFEQLYSSILGVLMTRVFTGPQWTEQKVRDVVDELAGFA